MLGPSDTTSRRRRLHAPSCTSCLLGPLQPYRPEAGTAGSQLPEPGNRKCPVNAEDTLSSTLQCRLRGPTRLSEASQATEPGQEGVGLAPGSGFCFLSAELKGLPWGNHRAAVLDRSTKQHASCVAVARLLLMTTVRSKRAEMCTPCVRVSPCGSLHGIAG